MQYLPYFAKIEDINFWIGLVLNILLCSFAVRCKQKSLDRYKYLILLFATFDIVYSIVQYILVERVITVRHIFSIFLVGEFTHSRHATSFYCSFYTLSFVLLDYQFLFRYWAVKSFGGNSFPSFRSFSRPDRLVHFTAAPFQALLACLAALEFSAWYATCLMLMQPSEAALADLIPLALEKYGVGDIEMGWIVSDYWASSRNGTYNWTAIGGSISTISILSTCFGFMFFAALSIHHHIAHTSLVSDRAKAMQMRLFCTLCAQTAVPLIFFYIPCGCSVNLPLAGVNVPYLSDCVPLLISFFPVLDAIVVILLIRDFRAMFIPMLCPRMIPEEVGKSSASHAINLVVVKTRSSPA